MEVATDLINKRKRNNADAQLRYRQKHGEACKAYHKMYNQAYDWKYREKRKISIARHYRLHAEMKRQRMILID